MKNKIGVSVIIPNLNSPIIDKTIASLKNQSYDSQKIEIIVVGQDRFGLIKEDERIRFIRTEHRATCGEARNIGCRHAQGEIFCFTDADCVAERDWIKSLIKWHKKGFQVVGGSAKVDFEGVNFWSLSDNIASFFFQLPDGKKGVLRKGLIAHLNFSISRDLYFKIGGLDEDKRLSHAEDADLNARLRKLGYAIYFEPKAIICHHNMRNSLKSLLNHAIWGGSCFPRLVEKHPDYVKMIEKHYWYLVKSIQYPRWIQLLVLFPLKAFIDTIAVFVRHAMLLRYWYTFGGVFLSKLARYYTISKELKQKGKEFCLITATNGKDQK